MLMFQMFSTLAALILLASNAALAIPRVGGGGQGGSGGGGGGGPETGANSAFAWTGGGLWHKNPLP